MVVLRELFLGEFAMKTKILTPLVILIWLLVACQASSEPTFDPAINSKSTSESIETTSDVEKTSEALKLLLENTYDTRLHDTIQ